MTSGGGMRFVDTDASGMLVPVDDAVAVDMPHTTQLLVQEMQCAGLAMDFVLQEKR